MDVSYRAQVFPHHEDTVLRGIPGALAILGAIGFGVGVVDSDFREQLWPALIVCLLVAVVGGWLHFRIRARHVVALAAGRNDDGLWVELDGARRPAARLERGVYRDYNGRQSYLVAWVALSAAPRGVVVRKGLGIADARPDWPEANPPPGVSYRGDPIALYDALA